MAPNGAIGAPLITNFRRKLPCKEDLQTEAVVELFRRAWQKQQQAASFCDDEHPERIGGIGEELVRIYMRRAAPPIQPAAIEQRTMRVVLASVRIQAQIDILDEDGMIIAINTPDQHHHLVDVFAESLRLRPRGFQLLSDSGIIAAAPVTLRA